jgi:carbonic anhydrase
MRRGLLVGAAALCASGLVGLGCASSGGSTARALDNSIVSTPDAALQALREGNQRFVSERTAHPAQNDARRDATATAQDPFAVILSCADSRVPPEILFDRGIGELFVIRTAGNLADDIAVGSIEFGVAVAGAPLVVVLGHESCGAVAAAKGIVDNNDPRPPGSIGVITDQIIPAVNASRGMAGDPLEAAIQANVERTVRQLERSPILSQKIAAGELKIVGGRYDLDQGRVTFYN